MTNATMTVEAAEITEVRAAFAGAGSIKLQVWQRGDTVRIYAAHPSAKFGKNLMCYQHSGSGHPPRSIVEWSDRLSPCGGYDAREAFRDRIAAALSALCDMTCPPEVLWLNCE